MILIRPRWCEFLGKLSPELRKRQRFFWKIPLVGVSYCAANGAPQADVKPNTWVRLAKEFGFSGYDDDARCLSDRSC